MVTATEVKSGVSIFQAKPKSESTTGSHMAEVAGFPQASKITAHGPRELCVASDGATLLLGNLVANLYSLKVWVFAAAAFVGNLGF